MLVKTYDSADGSMSKYIGIYLNVSPEASWTDFLQQLTAQYAEYEHSSCSQKVRIRQGKSETFSELLSRLLNLVKIRTRYKVMGKLSNHN